MKIEDLRAYAHEHNILLSTSLELTQKCNFKCTHCYCSERTDSDLPTEGIKEIIDKLYDFGCLMLTLTGGEILLRKDFIEIYNYAKNKGFVISLMTNASLIDNEIVNVLKQYRPHDISITLYGTNENEYGSFTGNSNNYTNVINGLNLLKENNLKFKLKTVVTHSTVNAIANGGFDEIAKKYETIFYYDPLIFPKQNGEDTPLKQRLSPEEIIQLEKKHPIRSKEWKSIVNTISERKYEFKCTGGIYTLSINHRGEANICGLYRVANISVLKNKMEYIWEALKNERKKLEDIVNNSECYECDYIKICKWCPAYSLLENNCINKKINYFCKLANCRYNEYITK